MFISRSLLTTALLLGATSFTFANTSQAVTATYILQVSSNLNCESLAIELQSTQSANKQYIQFGAGAFAAATLPDTTYEFGEVSCTKDNDTQRYDLLKGKMSPLTVEAGKTYYGGRIIFKEAPFVDTNDAPDELSECTNMRGSQRGESDSQCRDGAGVNSQSTTQVSVFVPEVTEDNIEKVRKALSASKDQLLYLPLKG
ncbi:MAG: hypothetical protein WA981_09750 [Glaciecola sp.]